MSPLVLALALFAPSGPAQAGDGVFDAHVTLTQQGQMTVVQRDFMICFDPRGKDRKFVVKVKMVAGSLSPDPDEITVKSDGTVESKLKMTYQSEPFDKRTDPAQEACYRVRHSINIPMGGLKRGERVSLTLSIPALKRKRGGTHQAEQVVYATAL